MSDLISKLVKANFAGPIIKCLSAGEDEQAVISVGTRRADGEISNEEEWGCLAAGESIQILAPAPGEVWVIGAEDLNDDQEIDSGDERDHGNFV